MIKHLLAKLPFFSAHKNIDSYIGLVVGLNHLTAVRLQKKQEQLLVTENKSFVLTNESEFSRNITHFIDELREDNTQVAVVLPNHMYQIVQMDKPSLTDEEIKKSLRWTVKDLVTIPVENIVADYVDNPIKQGFQDKITTFVANKALLMPIINGIEKSHAELSKITSEELVLAGLVAMDNAAHLIIHQHKEQEPSIQIIKDGALVFTRRLRGFSLLSSLTIEELKAGLLDNFSLEIQRSIDFFESQLKQPPLKTLQLFLPSEVLPQIIEQLTQHFVVKVTGFEPGLAHCSGQKENFYFAIGAAMELTGRENEVTH